MAHFNLSPLVLPLFAFFAVLPVQAQKRKAATATVVPALTSEQLIQDYRFAEAVRQIGREIETARKAGKSTVRLEADLKRASLGEDLMRGVEQVVFIDSVVVKSEAVLPSIRFSPEAGKLVPFSSQADDFATLPAETGQMAYINELGDRIFFAATDTARAPLALWSAYRVGKTWAQARPLDGMGDDASDHDCPFVMPDGVTLYFAAQSDESLGGYDLFVTRYDPESKQYLKAEMLGMPFNSPANDYLLAIDEAAQIGWLVTDRGQKAGDVCIYTFIPGANREIYDAASYSPQALVHAARIHSIAESQTDAKAVEAARQRLLALGESPVDASGRTHRYVINDRTVYTQPGQFRNATARRLAAQADELEQQIEALAAKQDKLQLSAAQGQRTQKVLGQLRQINQTLPELRRRYAAVCKEMRQAEASSL